MSFGRPGAMSDNFKVSPPLRGSFPLDHEGECKDFMISYMSCLKQNRNNAGPCRAESRAYLECRMDKNLMSREDFQKLGLGDVQPRKPDDPPAATPASTSSASAKTAKEPSRGGWFGAGSASSSGGDSNERLV